MQLEPWPLDTCDPCTHWSGDGLLEFETGTNITFSHFCRDYACECLCGPDDMTCRSWPGNECVFIFGRFYPIGNQSDVPAQ